MKKLTITIDDDVYASLHGVIGRGKISSYMNDLVKPRLLQSALEAGYAAMAADEEREREGLEWCEGLIGDAFGDETDGAS